MINTRNKTGWASALLVVVMLGGCMRPKQTIKAPVPPSPAISAAPVAPVVSATEKSDMAEAMEKAKAKQPMAESLSEEFRVIAEPRWEETKTLALVETKLRQWIPDLLVEDWTVSPPNDIEQLRNRSAHRFVLVKAKGGQWLDFTGSISWERDLFRADVDAIPVTTKDANGKIITVVKHSCGHNNHVAALLTWVNQVVQAEIVPTHNIRAVFERSEENPFDGRSGALMLISEGVLKGINKVYAQHIWVDKETGQPGTFASNSGPLMANNDQFFVEADATGGHGAQPQNFANAIDILHAVDFFLTAFGARYAGLGPFEPLGTSNVAIQGGHLDQANERPSVGFSTYSFRTYLLPEQRKLVAAKLADLVSRVGDVFKVYDPNAKATLRFVEGYPVTVNTPAEFTRIANALEGANYPVKLLKETGSESFSYYLLQRPGAYFMFGGWKDGSGGHHSFTFDPNRSGLYTAVGLWDWLSTH